MTNAGRQATAALAVAVAMTVGGQASANDAPIAVTDPSFDTWQATAIRTSRGASAQTAPPADRQRMNRVRSGQSSHRRTDCTGEPTFDYLR